MPIPGWAPSGGSWTTHLAGWPQPVPPPDYEAINTVRQARAITVSLNEFKASNVDLAGTREEISLESIEGWWDPVSDTTETTRHPSGDGDISFRLRQGGRVITVAGMIETDYANRDAERLLTLMDQVTAETRSGTLLVQENLRSMNREIDVRRQSLQMTPLGHAYAVFTLVLVADDPLRYGTSTQEIPTRIRVAVRNYGDARSYPVIEWVGAASNPGIDFGSRSWRLGQSTSSGDTIRADFRNGTFYRNGSRIFPAWTGFWPFIDPGALTFQSVGLPATMYRRSAWS